MFGFDINTTAYLQPKVLNKWFAEKNKNKITTCQLEIEIYIRQG